MNIRGNGYNQIRIRIRIHIIMDSQIPVYYTRGYPFSYPPHARDGFYPRVPMGMSIFATHISKSKVHSGFRSNGGIHHL